MSAPVHQLLLSLGEEPVVKLKGKKRKEREKNGRSRKMVSEKEDEVAAMRGEKRSRHLA